MIYLRYILYYIYNIIPPLREGGVSSISDLELYPKL